MARLNKLRAALDTVRRVMTRLGRPIPFGNLRLGRHAPDRGTSDQVDDQRVHASAERSDALFKDSRVAAHEPHLTSKPRLLRVRKRFENVASQEFSKPCDFLVQCLLFFDDPLLVWVEPHATPVTLNAQGLIAGNVDDYYSAGITTLDRTAGPADQSR